MKIENDVIKDTNMFDAAQRASAVMGLRFRDGAELISSQIMGEDSYFYVVLFWRYK